jgi:hypothetical protein
VGLRVYTEEDLEKAKAWFEKAGLPADAVGTPLEFCATMETRRRLTVQF